MQTYDNHPELTAIAKRILGLETLESRNRDSLDFKEHAVSAIRLALLEAYATGFNDGCDAAGNESMRQKRIGVMQTSR